MPNFPLECTEDTPAKSDFSLGVVVRCKSRVFICNGVLLECPWKWLVLEKGCMFGGCGQTPSPSLFGSAFLLCLLSWFIKTEARFLDQRNSWACQRYLFIVHSGTEPLPNCQWWPVSVRNLPKNVLFGSAWIAHQAIWCGRAHKHRN